MRHTAENILSRAFNDPVLPVTIIRVLFLECEGSNFLLDPFFNFLCRTRQN